MAGGEKFIVPRNKLADKVKERIRQGNIKRVRLTHEEKALIDILLTAGAPAAAVTVLASSRISCTGSSCSPQHRIYH